jgi:hypothetical protein
MVSIKVYISGNEFSSPWVSNWTGTLSLISNLPPNQLKFNYKFINEKDKFLETNLAIAQDAEELQSLDWLVFLSNEILWPADSFLRLIKNGSYDAISGWHLNESNTTDIIERLDTTLLHRNNAINYMSPDEIVKKPLPFKVEYTNMNFFAVKANTFSQLTQPYFKQVILEETTSISNNSVIVPWYYSFCNRLNAIGKEIFVDPMIRVSKISRSLL